MFSIHDTVKKILNFVCIEFFVDLHCIKKFHACFHEKRGCSIHQDRNYHKQ